MIQNLTPLKTHFDSMTSGEAHETAGALRYQVTELPPYALVLYSRHSTGRRLACLITCITTIIIPITHTAIP